MPDPLTRLRACIDQALRHVGDPGIVPHLATLCDLYRSFDDSQRLAFFRMLAIDLEATTVPDAPRAPDLQKPADVDRLLALRDALDCPRHQLLGQFVNISGGIKYLVDLRADLRDTMRDHRDVAPLRLLDEDLLSLFRGWFNFGFLKLVPINWNMTSAAQLEKIMADDVVHPMSSWADLRRRLDRDRLCYAFYHPNMPDEPLVFVEIALTRTITGSIDRLFTGPSVERIEDATTAIFYSINNTQPGLAGVSLGNSLIKTVVAQLQRNWPNLKRFSTLSPMPGFRDRYVETILRGKKGFTLSRDDFGQFFDDADRDIITAAGGGDSFAGSLQRTLDSDDWVRNSELRAALKPGMLRLAHHYLVHEKKDASPVNPVASFHLKNGAELYNINFLSNTGPKGMAESYGLTVNYHYDLRHIDDNRDRARDSAVIVSPQLDKMLKLGVSA